MMKLVLLLSAVFMISCSSKPKEPEAPREEATLDDTTVTPLMTNTSVDKINSGTPSVAAPPANVPKEALKASASQLEEAIRSQNDEKIFKASTQALLQNPADPKALNALALYNYKKGHLVAAKYLLTKAIQVQASSETYNNLGIVNLSLNENREALQAFRQAFNLNPQDPVTAANLGAIFVDQKDYNKAVVALETAYQKGIKDFRVLNNYAIALTATGKGAQAQAVYEKALKDQSNNKDILFNEAVLLVEVLKKYKEGSDVLNRLKFVGGTQEQRERIKELENKVKIGLQ